MNKEKDILQIRKYLNGELNGYDMHSLERRALDDSLLADALEGFEQIGVDQQVNLDELKSRLQQRIHDKKVKRMIPWGSLSIAASLLIIIGTIIWLFNGRQKDEKVPLFTRYIEPEKKNTKLRKKENPTFDIPPSSGTIVTSEKDDNISDVKQPTLNVQSKKNVDTVAELAALTNEGNSHNVSGFAQSVNEEQKPENFYNPQIGSITAKELVVSNIDRKKDAKHEVMSRGEVQSYIGTSMQSPMQTAPVMQSNKTIAGVVKGSNDSMNRGGMGYADIKKNDDVVYQDARPSIGWQAYNEYLKKNALSPDGKTGKVKVSLMVGIDGSLSQFKIIKSLSDGANKKAIELINNGPVWVGRTNGKSEEVKVTIEFKNSQ